MNITEQRQKIKVKDACREVTEKNKDARKVLNHSLRKITVIDVCHIREVIWERTQRVTQKKMRRTIVQKLRKDEYHRMETKDKNQRCMDRVPEKKRTKSSKSQVAKLFCLVLPLLYNSVLQRPLIIIFCLSLTSCIYQYMGRHFILFQIFGFIGIFWNLCGSKTLVFT